MLPDPGILRPALPGRKVRRARCIGPSAASWHIRTFWNPHRRSLHVESACPLHQGVVRMNHPVFLPGRRAFLGSVALGLGASSFFTVRGAFAEELARTPRLTEGPFYPRKLPLDTDNDLLIINDSITPAVGEITHLTGKILDAKGTPIPTPAIDISQAHSPAAYLHPP